MQCDTECWEQAKPLDRQFGNKQDNTAGGISVMAGSADKATLKKEIAMNSETMRVVLEAMLTGVNPVEWSDTPRRAGQQVVQKVVQ